MPIRSAGLALLAITIPLCSVASQAQKPSKKAQDPGRPVLKTKQGKPARAIRMTPGGSSTTPPTPKELKERLAKKLKGAWIQNVNWRMDLDEARAEAKASGKQIFAYFTRSYAP